MTGPNPVPPPNATGGWRPWRRNPSSVRITPPAGQKKSLLWPLLLSLLALLLLAYVAVGSLADWHPFWDDNKQPVAARGVEPSPSPEVVVTPTPVPTPVPTVVVSVAPFDPKAVAAQLAEIFQGFKPGEIKTGPEVDPAKNPEERGLAAFSTETLKTNDQVAEFLNGTSPQNEAAYDRVIRAIKAAGYGEDEIERALDGSGYFPVQVSVASQILGTTYFQGGKVLDQDGKYRALQANDLFWLFRTRDNKIIKGATIRADCANPGIIKVVPARDRPPAAPVGCARNCVVPKPSPTPVRTTPPTKYCPETRTRVPANNLCPKRAEQDPQSRGNVPPPARQDRPADDNQAEASRSPEAPSDSGNGIPSGSPPRRSPPPPSPQPARSSPPPPAVSPEPVKSQSPQSSHQATPPPPPA